MFFDLEFILMKCKIVDKALQNGKKAIFNEIDLCR